MKERLLYYVKNFIFLIVIAIGILGNHPVHMIYASNGHLNSDASITNFGQAIPSYIVISNKISDLDFNHTYTFQTRKVGLETTNLTWWSSNKSVATVSSTGKVTAKSAGSVKITVKDKISGKKSSCTFRVRPKETPSSYFEYSITDGKAKILKYIGAKSYKEVVIPRYIKNSPVTIIGDYSFYKTSITSIDFPSTVSKIDPYAFYYCTSLKKVMIPDSVKSVGNAAFANCSSLTGCSFPNSMKSLGNYVFAYCSSLTNVVLPSSCTSVGSLVFSATPLESLTNIRIASGLGSEIFLDSEEATVYKNMKATLKKIVAETDTEIEKVKKVHDWIIKNCIYDERYYKGTTIPDSSYSCIGLMKYHTAVCAGYAETFQIFMDLLGINCITVIGQGITPDNEKINHAWNLVQLDKEWYHIDVTWDDPYSDIGNVSYEYFLLDDEVMKKDHIWDSGSYTAASGSKYSDYAYEPYICTTKSEILAAIKKQQNNKQEWITIVTANKDSLSSILQKYSYQYYKPYPYKNYYVYRFCIK